MRSKPVLRLQVLGLALILLAGCGKYNPKPNEEIYGTWTNMKSMMQKTDTFVGGWKNYVMATDTSPTAGEGTQEIEARWTDSEGNIWYKTFGTITAGQGQGEKFQTLQKISKSGTSREWVYATVDKFNPKNYPTKIAPTDPNYMSYTRAGN